MIYIIRTRDQDRSGPLIDNLNMEYKLVDGFNGSKIKNAGFKYFAYEQGIIPRPRPMVKGEMGVLISQTMAITMAKAYDEPYIVIFEDDARVAKDFEDKLKVILQYEHNADILMLGAILLHKDQNIGPNISYGVPIRKVQHSNVYGMHAYIVYKKAYDKVLDILYTQANCCDDLVLNNKELEVLMCDPWLAYQDEVESVIWPERGVTHQPNSKFKYRE